MCVCVCVCVCVYARSHVFVCVCVGVCVCVCVCRYTPKSAMGHILKKSGGVVTCLLDVHMCIRVRACVCAEQASACHMQSETRERRKTCWLVDEMSAMVEGSCKLKTRMRSSVFRSCITSTPGCMALNEDALKDGKHDPPRPSTLGALGSAGVAAPGAGGRGWPNNCCAVAFASAVA